MAGDHLKLNFNETGSSSIEVYGKEADGTEFGAISSESLGINGVYDFSRLDAQVDAARSHHAKVLLVLGMAAA